MSNASESDEHVTEFRRQRAYDGHLGVRTGLHVLGSCPTTKTAQRVREKRVTCSADHVVRERLIMERPPQAYLEDKMGQVIARDTF